MPTYRYAARDERGVAVSGTLTAATQDALADQLKRRGYFITASKELRNGAASERRTGRGPRVREEDLALCYIELAKMVHAGIPLLSALQAITRQTTHPTLQRILSEVAALDAVGDAFGVYAFSGAGRADVRVQVLKELGERLSGAVASRLEAVKPVHTTRMGAAVRHATARLRRHEARTRLLVLISDGRPFDLDYGQEYGEGAEVDYAIRDTRAALGEARAAGVEPFVLTVDPAGGDYLRELAGGLDYEVLVDTASLPLRLLALYRRLAA